ncbi:uncharacterized protein EI97DRAFT_394795 [Westerdykella ornata]|uniref:SEC7 domain-containing protein n=1 Tax=Westerdykella ornata TaxID=318751 RepID=A0A6A6JQM8_WESOR|nr:uncharacterized protein EI97DRAFT_394795 [Westerdykella ornata]KAF2278413.1 hypothetical protein EI97DRAFT_394795 [Westerdykella ornata]
MSPMAGSLDTRLQAQETFYDDATPVDNHRVSDIRSEDHDNHDPRDSHDLSLHGDARTSVVDNMLLSLDQFSIEPAALYSDFFSADHSYQPSRPTRNRGHTYASSVSSDYEQQRDETSSRYSSHQSRGRRSNSSNNIPAAMSRKGSLRTYASIRDKQLNTMYSDTQDTRPTRSGGRKGSKGSAASSMDYGYAGILGTHRFGFGRRSASFDHGHIADRSNTMTGRPDSILDRSRVGYHTYGDYEAAPEPTVPVGPRRVQETPQSPVFSPSQPPFATAQPSAPRRRNSIRSTASRTLRKNKSQPAPNMRFQAQEFVNASTFPDLPIRPAIEEPPAPSPTVATRKQALPAPSTPVATPKEKPGFFRRVFGGSSKNQAQVSSSSNNYSNKAQADASPASAHHRGLDASSKHSQPRPQTTPNGSHHIASQLKSLPQPPQTATSTQREAAPPTLAKKHSSFFRRRKKSTSESNKPLPIMALDFRPPTQEKIPPPAPSPGISSLRQVMNPYLDDLGSPSAKYHEQRVGQAGSETVVADVERPHGFSPGYKPHADATVRTVKLGSRGVDETPPSSREEHIAASRALSSGSPRLKLKMKNRKSALIDAQDGSFLADSSSCNEDHTTPSGEARLSRTVPPSPSFEEIPRENKTLKDQRKASINTRPAPSHSMTDLEDEDEWVLTPAAPNQHTAPRKSPATGQRVWLEPTSSEEKLDLSLSLPLDGTQEKAKDTFAEKSDPTSPQDVFHSATSLPLVQVESRESQSDAMPPAIEQHPVHDEEPTEADRERARLLFNNEDTSVQRSQVATVLGDVTSASARVRKAYMELFDWTGFNILAAMRDLCGRLVLKAETQQVDRILMSLSERWCECNPNHGFKATDVVHTICYSILLLNTDLHVANIESRMTRNQFVKNTLPTVVRVCQEAIKDGGDETLRPHSAMATRGSIPWNRSEPNSPAAENTTFPADIADEPLENRRARSRLSIKPPVRAGSEGLISTDSATAESNTLVNHAYHGPMKGWEYQIETVLKEFYNSIRNQRLPLHGASNHRVHEQPSSNNLSVNGVLRRTPSVLSKAPSENLSYRGRSQGEFRSVGNRWVSKTRSRPRLYPSSTVASSRTSLDETSVWSPAGSSTWSRYSIGKTGTSMMSMESLGSHFAHGDYQQAIGFANALSQAIIREEGMTMEGSEEFTRVAPLLEDETLELAGAPWAKEGILKHKHHLEALDKKAKDRTWNECFAVIEKGYMRLFSFSMNSKTMRMKNKSRPSAGSVVGGGNWMDNAEALDCFLLRQSIASALPPPGYSKNRPHVWALSLPTGAVHLFQVGTPDIVREFVSTANYWSARLSKEPLVGGVSNIEYGWGETVINPALIRKEGTPSAHHGHVPRPSMASSLRSSVDHATGVVKPRLPGDKVVLADWTPPAQSMMASNLMEVDQLRALTDYVKNVEDELARHNELRAPMLIAFSPRHPNAAKAMSNWERKSSYLLREIVKFRTYIDSLTAAQAQKAKIYAQREAEKSQNGGMNMDSSGTEISATAEVDGANKAPESEP